MLAGAGDIALCEAPAAAEATARVLDALVEAVPRTRVFTTGDHAYPRATAEALERCYGPRWGRFNARTYPTPGNHDYQASAGEPYFEYFDFFDRHPGARPRGYYSFEAGSWRVFALNSMLTLQPGAVQLQWLERALEREAADCVLAYWHHPLFSSGRHGYLPWDAGRDTDLLWRPLLAHGVDVIVNGHEHFYERFAPLDADGRRSADGVRQFVAGTGGGRLRGTVLRRGSSEYASTDVYGVLVLILHPGSYEWAFIGVDGVVHDRSERPVPCSGPSDGA